MDTVSQTAGMQEALTLGPHIWETRLSEPDDSAGKYPQEPSEAPGSSRLSAVLQGNRARVSHLFRGPQRLERFREGYLPCASAEPAATHVNRFVMDV